MKKSRAFAFLAVCLLLTVATLPAQQRGPQDAPPQGEFLQPDNHAAKPQPGKQDQKPALQKPGKPEPKKDDFKGGKPEPKKDDFKAGKPEPKKDDFKGGKPIAPPREEAKPDRHDHEPLGHELSAPPKPMKLRIPKAQGSTTPDGWFDDWNEARAEARRTGRCMLVLFTGSDWCHWCKVLKKKVLNTKEFKRFAEQKLVLVYMDEPSKKTLPKRVRQTRTMLRQILQPGDGVPAIVLLTPEGKKIDTIQGYDEDLVDHLKQVIR